MRLVRPKLRFLALAPVCLALGWVPAPAASAQEQGPRAADFEGALTGVRPTGGLSAAKPIRARAGSGPVSFRSAVIAAPRRFDLVGLAGELRPLELRARDAGEAWSGWVPAEDGNPVYFGGADELQLRARGWRPAGTLHYVDVAGTAADDGPAGPRAAAKPTRPTIVSRARWGANRRRGGCPPRVRPTRGAVEAAVIHHTVTANEYSEAEAPGIVLGICRYHRNANGWNDIGYNALVDRFGNLYAGRAGGMRKAIVGAQAQGFNSQTTAISSIGTHTKEAPTALAVTSIVNYLAWKLAAHGLNATGKTTIVSAGGDLSRYPAGRRVRLNRVIGHGTVGLTACPGDALAKLIVQIRRRIQARIDEFGGVTSPPGGGGVTPR